MFGIDNTQLLIIIIVLIILFGARKIPEFAKSFISGKRRSNDSDIKEEDNKLDKEKK